MKIALIFNRKQRVRLGERCQSILERDENLEISQYDLEEIQSVKEGYDLYFRIDDGDYTVNIPSNLHPSVWWISDTHYKKTYKKIRRNSRNYDHLFCCQKEGAKKLSHDLKKEVYWVPWAADEVPTDFRFKVGNEKKWNICFIGTSGKYSLRKVVLEKIKLHYPNRFIGRVDYKKLRDYYSKSRIVVNYSKNNDINARIFEAMSGGALVITNKIRDNGFDEIFKENVHLVTFEDIISEMKEKVDYYLKHVEKREKIAKAGFELVRENHTYPCRLKEIFNTLGYNLKI